MSGPVNVRLLTTKVVLWWIVGIAAIVAAARFAFGLGAATALTDTTPWGMWIGFDVLAGVALAAGGFVIAATVHVFRIRKYEPLVRPAILTAFLGYIAVILGLVMDLGRPWNIWRMMFFWQPDSPLFEVGWCVMLYTTVLALEFAPVVFERLRWERPRRVLRRLSLLLVTAGIGLSTLHQSSLGTLFLLTRDRLHPLWWSPALPLMFFVSAVGLGLCMVTAESLASSWLFRRPPEWNLLRGLTRAAGGVLGLYLVIRIGDLVFRGEIRHVIDGTWASALFVVEILLSAVVPLLLFGMPSLRRRPAALAAGAWLGVAGFVLHRADVGGIAHVPLTGELYVPALTEVAISAGVVSGLALVFLFFLERFPVWEERPELPDHFTPPLRDPVSRTYLGGRWFGRTRMAAAAWIAGALVGLVLVEATVVGGRRPEPDPVREARATRVVRSERSAGPGHVLRLAAYETSAAAADTTPALLIDGDRAGTWVLFEHDAHRDRLGGERSCGQCHHRNLPLSQGTRCTECHRDMYRDTDTFSHASHVSALEGNASCRGCHRSASQPKTRAASRPCDECHGRDRAAVTRVRVSRELPAGIAPGYRDAMHALCIGCHLEEDGKRVGLEPYLSRCQACHRGHAPDGRDLHLREGRSLPIPLRDDSPGTDPALSARLEEP